MGASGKLLQKMRQGQSGWRINDLISVAESNGIEWRRPGRGGSHVIFSAEGVREIVSVPDKRPIKPVYVRQFVALIDASRDVAGEDIAEKNVAKKDAAKKDAREGDRNERKNHKAKP
jgi:hypothetical protein